MPSTSPSLASQRLRTRLNRVIGFAAASVCVIGLFYFWQFYGVLSDEQSTWADFGNYFGGALTPALAFLSLIALLWTIQLQSDALEVSREELRRSTEQLEKSAKALQKQNFEGTYFQMLRRFNDSVGEMSQGDGKGRDVLFRISMLLFNKLNSASTDDIASLKARYEEFHQKYRKDLDPYFRLLFHIFTFIDRSELLEDERVVYANIARAQLTNYELRLLFYNGMVGEGKQGFKPLIERYGLLKHLDDLDLATYKKPEQRNEYHNSAFMSASDRQRSASASRTSESEVVRPWRAE